MLASSSDSSHSTATTVVAVKQKRKPYMTRETKFQLYTKFHYFNVNTRKSLLSKLFECQMSYLLLEFAPITREILLRHYSQYKRENDHGVIQPVALVRKPRKTGRPRGRPSKLTPALKYMYQDIFQDCAFRPMPGYMTPAQLQFVLKHKGVDVSLPTVKTHIMSMHPAQLNMRVRWEIPHDFGRDRRHLNECENDVFIYIIPSFGDDLDEGRLIVTIDGTQLPYVAERATLDSARFDYEQKLIRWGNFDIRWYYYVHEVRNVLNWRKRNPVLEYIAPIQR